MNYLGIDIGGTKIAGAIVSSEGSVKRRMDVSTPAMEGGARVLEAAVALARTLRAGETIGAAGIGAGGQIDAARGVVLSATDLLPGWAGIDIKSAFEDALRVPAFADNDVNALAVGEARFGAAKGKASAVFVAIGTGLGGAFVLDGRLVRGAHGSGGEFGHILFDISSEARRGVGRYVGTWEAYVSGPGLLATYKLLDPAAPPLTGRDIADAARRAPDGLAAQAIRRTGEYLGMGLASLANALDPDIFIIGGGLAELGDALLDPARAFLQSHALPGPAQCPIVPAALGADASVIGAAALAMEQAPCR